MDQAQTDMPVFVEVPPAPIYPQTITVHQCNDSGVYVATIDAYMDPREPGRYLIPRGATDVAPPALAVGEEAAHIDGAWVKRKKLDPVAAPADTMTPSQRRREQITQRLDAIDKASARSLRESLIEQSKGKALPAFAVKKLTDLEAEAVVLRAEMAGLAP